MQAARPSALLNNPIMDGEQPDSPADDLNRGPQSLHLLWVALRCIVVGSLFLINHYFIVPSITVNQLAPVPGPYQDPALSLPITLDGVRCSVDALRVCEQLLASAASTPCCKSVLQGSKPESSVPDAAAVVVSVLVPLVLFALLAWMSSGRPAGWRSRRFGQDVLMLVISCTLAGKN